MEYSTPTFYDKFPDARCTNSSECSEPFSYCEYNLCSCPEGEYFSVVSGCSPSVWYDVGISLLWCVLSIVVISLTLTAIHFIVREFKRRMRARRRRRSTRSHSELVEPDAETVSKVSDSPPPYDEVSKFPPSYAEALKMERLQQSIDSKHEDISPETMSAPWTDSVLHI
ncbi:EB domain [Trinorchestia longiramus]|nr:EB domain [Trinorchestia longiramus]